jgi:octaprenyl-diphosphate synthase
MNGRAAGDLFRPIARDMASMEAILRSTIESARPGVGKLIEHLAHYRGKRLRPALLLLTARACGQVSHAHHVLAAVVEMIHTATLVHDDVLDGATVRRHVSTINAAWGNQASILLGDYLFTHAFHLTSTLDDASACRLIGEATNRLCAGELHQVCERGNLALSEEAYFDIIGGKTAELTSCCCRLGALYAGMDDESVEKLATFGRCLGMAFQIADDLLDLVGEERAAGKSLGTDLEQQKLTLPVIYLLQNGTPAKTQELRTLLDHPGRPTRARLAAELAAAGALDYARRRAERFAAQAAAELTILPPSECKSILEHLTDKVVHRDR